MLNVDLKNGFALVKGHTVELRGPQAHPFMCVECANCYREHRHAARCHKVASLDLRTSMTCDFDAVAEAEMIQADQDRWDAESAEYNLECSCGESFKELSAAIACRKCRTYTAVGWCTEVIDRNTDEVVWTAIPAGWNPDSEETK